MIGKVLWFDMKKGFGFIRSEGIDYFVHYSKIIANEGEYRTLEEGEQVQFDPMDVNRPDGSNKPQAKNVKRMESDNENPRKRSNSTI